MVEEALGGLFGLLGSRRQEATVALASGRLGGWLIYRGDFGVGKGVVSFAAARADAEFCEDGQVRRKKCGRWERRKWMELVRKNPSSGGDGRRAASAA
jgi:hypothetical protein